MKNLKYILTTSLLLIALSSCSTQTAPIETTPEKVATTTPSVGKTYQEIFPDNPCPFPPTQILMFHYIRTVDKTKDLLGYNLSFDPKSFEELLKSLKEYGYATTHVKSLLDCSVFSKDLGIILTFDDGYEDFYTTAWPLLKKYGFTASIAIITGKMDGKDYMTPDQVVDLHNQGVEILDHTINHVDLSTSPNALKEITDSKKYLEDLLKEEINILVYPSGKYNAKTVQLAKDAGYKIALTTKLGTAKNTQYLFELPRIRVDNRDSVKNIMEKIKPWGGLYGL